MKPMKSSPPIPIPTPAEAYKKECKNYQDFGGDKGKLINDRYPQAPDYDETSSSSSEM